MASANSQKRILIRKFHRAAVAASGALLTQIQALADDLYAQQNAGTVVTGTSGGGHSATFALPPGYSPMDLAADVEAIETEYEKVLAWLSATDPDDITDIVAELLDRFDDSAPTEITNDFTLLRWSGT